MTTFSEPTTALTAPGVSLEITSVSKEYERGRRAIDDLSVTIEAGETLCVLGPSGCGKSTLLRLVAGLESPDAGEIRVGDRLLSRPGLLVPPDRRGINMVFQDYALWPHMPVRDIIGYGLRYGAHRVNSAERAARVEELMRFLQLDGLADRRPAEISGGQQQRVAIARALATSPELLLFDEPLSNLDVQLRAAMREELATLLASLGTTTIYVTHDVSEALALADRILVLHQGRIVQLDSPQGLFTRPRSTWVASLAGFSSTLTPDAAYRDVPETARAVIGSFSLHGRDCGGDASAHDGTAAPTVHVHADAIRVVSAHESGPNIVSGLVQSSVFEGSAYRTRLSVAHSPGEHAVGGSLVFPSEHRLDRDQPVHVRIDPAGVLIFGAQDRLAEPALRGSSREREEGSPAWSGWDRDAVHR
ncbi:ABC transporter ATP-binding protein [Ruania alkalisoli]|uniref:ABC-type quaternary amine transporter n=1 Tax=Ruania alkalisoli TaxID=2779775 RepID=A0A7M1SXZ7_9MICO|nr:ABC transporter ATP-binding protein [Ruania alkalisoli]QOR72391.1 ABC transporter ATP-binding protein [Ruania alkalisoli]